MRLIAPDGYTAFRCIADRCRHTCCKGWEIDIDSETMARYRSLQSPLKDALLAGIEEDDEGAHFRLDAEERCPMLTREGLCRVILEGGEALLCQVCADHPRFRSFFDSRTEIGLGLCCEEAARQILFGNGELKPVTIEDDGDEAEPSEDETWLLAFRDRLWDILLSSTGTLNTRLEQLLEECGAASPTFSLAEWADQLLTLEQLNPAWGEQLALLRSEESVSAFDHRFDEPLIRLTWYLLYRHLPGAMDDGLPEARAAMCVMLTRVVQGLFVRGDQTEERLVDLCRMMSSELEYSDENIGALLEKLEPTDE